MLRYSSELYWKRVLREWPRLNIIWWWNKKKKLSRRSPCSGCCRENWRCFITHAGIQSHPKCVIKCLHAPCFSPSAAGHYHGLPLRARILFPLSVWSSDSCLSDRRQKNKSIFSSAAAPDIPSVCSSVIFLFIQGQAGIQTHSEGPEHF